MSFVEPASFANVLFLLCAGNWATDYKKEWMTGSFGSSRLTLFKLSFLKMCFNND
jgi:hypothetical protein